MSINQETCIIKKWPCSYYDNTVRRWMNGTMCIMGYGIRFTSDDENSYQDIHYSNIAEVKKSMTGIIFRAVVVGLKNGIKHWFSSFSDAHSVVQFINFFLRSKLLQRKDTRSTKDTRIEKRTEMGSKLLTVAVDSEKTLQNAAEVLNTQGNQLSSAMATMMDLHSDLDVTENLVSGLESWLGRWSLPEEYKATDPIVVRDSDLSMEIDYEILYTKLEPNKLNAQNLGIFRLAQDGIYLMTDRQKVVHRFKWDDISRVRVVSPWEITVTRFQIGRADTAYSLVFTSAYRVLGILDKRLRSKVEYSQDAFREETSNTKPHSMTLNSNCSKELFQKKSEQNDTGVLESDHHVTGNSELNASGNSFNGSQVLQLSVEKTVSDQEVSELSSILGDLKSLALGVHQEIGEQDEKLDKLNRTVEEANIRVANTEKKIQKLL